MTCSICGQQFSVVWRVRTFWQKKPCLRYLCPCMLAGDFITAISRKSPPPPPLSLSLSHARKLLLYLTATVWQREDVKLFSSLCSSLKCIDIFHLHRSHSHSQDIALNIYLLLHMEGIFQTVIMCVRLTVQLEICVVFVKSMPALRLVPSHSSPVARGTHKVLWVSLSSSCLQWVPLPLLVMI